MATINRKEQELIDEVIENFNFEKCYLTMTLLNWTWANGLVVPTVEDLKTSALQRILSAINGSKENGRMTLNELYHSSSGGLKASVCKNRYDQITYINLEFVLTDWSTE